MGQVSPVRSRRALYLILFASLLALLPCSTPALAQNDSDHAKRLAAYFEEWSIYGANYNVKNIEASGAAAKLTHLMYAFGNVAISPAPPAIPTSANCVIADTWADYQDPNLPSVNGTPYAGPLFGNFAALLQLKQLHPDLKILISLGGASAANTAAFAAAAGSPALRSQLVSSCIDMFINGNVAPGISAAGVFDGIDVDWEFPGATDKTNFTLLLNEFRYQLNVLGLQNNRHYVLTIAAPAGEQNYSNMELSKVAQQLDFLNMETYDYHGTWETSTNHESPLFGSPKDPTRSQHFYADATIAAYLRAGVPARKMLLGIPFYGYGWTGVPDVNHGLYQTSTGPAPSPPGDTLATDGVATFGTLRSLTGFAHYRDPFTLAQWIYNPATQTFWTYDNAFSVWLKMLYVDGRVPGGLGGAMLWALKDDDANATLVKTMAKGLSVGR